MTIAATSNNIDDNPILNTYHAWGCDSGKYTRVDAVNPNTGQHYFTTPCFNIPTIVISPYARPHYVEHDLYDYTSILRYIEDQCHLPRLSIYDRRATSIGQDLNLNQAPLPPLILHQRTCPPGAYNNLANVTGTVLQVSSTKAQTSVLITIPGLDQPLRFVSEKGSIVEASNRERITVRAIQPDDQVRAIGLPTPDQALQYRTHLLRDLDLVPITEQGVVVSTDPSTDDIVLSVPHQKAAVVRITSSTEILLANDKRGSFADLEPGGRISLSGLRNRRTGRLSVISSVKVLGSRSAP